MTSHPSKRDVDRHLAIIAKLREVDTQGEHTKLCDREELEWRRLAMDGYPECNGGGITMPAHSDAELALLREWPEAYFEALEPFRVRWTDVVKVTAEQKVAAREAHEEMVHEMEQRRASRLALWRQSKSG